MKTKKKSSRSLMLEILDWFGFRLKLAGNLKLVENRWDPKKKWQLVWKKSNGCTVELQDKYEGKKGETITPVLFKGTSRYTLALDMDAEEAKSLSTGLRKCPETVRVPWKYNISYADILDRILKLMKKNDSACWLWESWHWTRERAFIERGATIESLAIEFDMSWRDVLVEA